MKNRKKMANDEFYTRLEDIEIEIIRSDYIEKFKNKIIYCNCDDSKKSKFWVFFVKKYDEFKLKGLIATYYPKNENEKAYKLEINEKIINDLMKKHNINREDLFFKFANKEDEYLPQQIEIFGNDSYGGGGILEVMNVLNYFKKVTL